MHKGVAQKLLRENGGLHLLVQTVQQSTQAARCNLLFFSRDLAGVWTGGLWNGHLCQTPKHAFRDRNLQDRRAACTKTSGSKIRNSEPSPQNSIPPEGSHSMSPLHSLTVIQWSTHKQVWRAPLCDKTEP